MNTAIFWFKILASMSVAFVDHYVIIVLFSSNEDEYYERNYFRKRKLSMPFSQSLPMPVADGNTFILLVK